MDAKIKNVHTIEKICASIKIFTVEKVDSLVDKYQILHAGKVVIFVLLVSVVVIRLAYKININTNSKNLVTVR